MSGAPLQTQPGGIVTPEAVVLEFETAGAGSRAAGEVLDVGLQLLVLGLIAGGAAAASSFAGDTAAAVIALVMTLLVLVGYPVASEALWNGRTLGKAALGLRVVTIEGGPIRFRHAAIRGIIGLFEIYVTLGSVALLVIIFSRRDQRLGDHTAGTIVLRERAARGQGALAVSFPPPWGMEGYVSSLEVSSLSAAQYGIIRSFLLRVLDFGPDARWALSVKLANATALELRTTPPAGLSPELFLACVAAAYQRGRLSMNPALAAYPPPTPGSALAPPAAARPGAAFPDPGTVGARIDAWPAPVVAPTPAPPPPWFAPGPPPAAAPPPPRPPVPGPPPVVPAPVPTPLPGPVPTPPTVAPASPPNRFPWDAPVRTEPVATPPAEPSWGAGTDPPDPDPEATR